MGWSKDISDDHVPNDLLVGVVGCRDFEFNLIRIIISELLELNLKDPILFGDNSSFKTIVAYHTCSNGHILKWILVLRDIKFANNLSIFILWKDLVDWHVEDFCLDKTFDLLVLTDGHWIEFSRSFKIVFCTRQHI